MAFIGSSGKTYDKKKAVNCPNCRKTFYLTELAYKQVGKAKCPHCGFETSGR